uniref:Uncharacterized protein n=1 Tax=Rhizophora mucronata TaxID=61149 RepID=A0A2P2N6L8_RHIMU
MHILFNSRIQIAYFIQK